MLPKNGIYEGMNHSNDYSRLGQTAE